MKLSIKSFKVPELFVDIPTTATVGSLKVCDLSSLSLSLSLSQVTVCSKLHPRFFSRVFEILIQKNRKISESMMRCRFPTYIGKSYWSEICSIKTTNSMLKELLIGIFYRDNYTKNLNLSLFYK